MVRCAVRREMYYKARRQKRVTGLSVEGQNQEEGLNLETEFHVMLAKGTALMDRI